MAVMGVPHEGAIPVGEYRAVPADETLPMKITVAESDATVIKRLQAQLTESRDAAGAMRTHLASNADSISWLQNELSRVAGLYTVSVTERESAVEELRQCKINLTVATNDVDQLRKETSDMRKQLANLREYAENFNSLLLNVIAPSTN
jgi:chromosome segregation ATPase